MATGGMILAGLMGAGPAWAELSDTVHPFVRLGYSHDNNLLRLSDNEKSLYGGDGSDNFRDATAGVAIERPIGRQLLTGKASVSRVSYDFFEQFDYTGKQAELDLKWMIGNHLSGHVGGSYSQMLSGFTDFRSNERNLRTERRAYADGAWRFHPSWQLIGSYAESRFGYELEAQQPNNRLEKLSAAGFDYVASSGSTFGFQVRRLEGNYPNQLAQGFDNSYTQDEQKINVNWLVSGTTQVLFLGGFVQRKHNTQSVRDDSGTNGRLIVNWAPRSRLTINSQLWREFIATEGLFINNALSKGALVKGTWEVTSKISWDAQAKYNKRDYTSFSLTGTPTNSDDANDSTRTLSSNVTYRPRPNIELVLGAFRDRRSGSVLARTNSYNATGVSFNATAQF